MSRRSRRQTRTRLTTGYRPEWHNEHVAIRKAFRRAERSLASALRAHRRLQKWMQAAAATVTPDLAELRAVEREQTAAADADRVQCLTCVTAGPMTPPHTPSPWCESGKHPHCTCSFCY